jgi:hypothetical protein
MFLSSCCQNVDTTCSMGNLVVFVRGFAESDLRVSATSSIPPYAVRYQPDNAFDVPIDSFMINHFNSGGDTFGLNFFDPGRVSSGVNDSFMNGLVLGYDYKIVIPADTITYLLTHIDAAANSHMVLQKCTGKTPPHCYKNAASCTVNGVVTPTNSAFGVTNNANLYTYRTTFIYLSK